MKLRSLIAIVGVALTMVLALVAFAQDEGVYEGAFTFTYPAGWEVTEGNDLVQLMNEGENITVFGPTSVGNILGGMSFDTDLETLSFVADRNGYTVGEEADMGDMTAIEVSLPRRDQSGVAVMKAIGYGRTGVVVYLSDDPMMESEALAQVVESYAHVATVADLEEEISGIIATFDTYDNNITFDYPSVIEPVEGNNLVKLTQGGMDLTVFAPAAVSQVLGGTDFDSEIGRLRFFLNRNGFEAGEEVESDGAAASTVTLERRGQSGTAYLLDLDYDRYGVVTVMSDGSNAGTAMGNVVSATVLETLAHPATVADLEGDLNAVLESFETYEGGFSVDYAVGVNLEEGNNLVKLTRGAADVTVFGDAAYTQVIGGGEFEDDASALNFFLDRNGYTIGDAAEAGDALAAFNVELPRRDQVGVAYLVDVEFGHRVVIAGLSGSETIDQALRNVIATKALETVGQLPTIADYLTIDENVSILLAAIDAADLTGTLDGGEFTVFAPTNEAFEAALVAMNMSAEDMLADTETLATILTYHVVEGSLTPSESTSVVTVEGSEIAIEVGDDGIVLNGSATVTGSVTDVSNGVIHVIDAVLIPPSVAEMMEVAALADAIPADTAFDGTVDFMYPGAVALTEGNNLAKLNANGAEVTAFAPEAYAQVIGNVELEEGADSLAFFADRNGFTVGDPVEAMAENVIAAVNVELPRRNQTGVAYLVDMVYGTGVVTALSEEGVLSSGTAGYLADVVLGSVSYPAGIAQLAAETDDLSILSAAVEAAGLSDTLNAGGVTVFAPTNEAITNALNTLGLSAEDLLGSGDILTEILTYHVTSGSVLAEAVVELDGESVEMLNGQTVAVSVTDAGVVLNDSINVTATDIEARDGGVIHMIDAVLMPQCLVSVDDPRGVRVTTRPAGAVITYLPADVDIAADARVTNNAGTFYRVDKFAATDIGNQVAETWVNAEGLTSAGVICDLLQNP
ncbi:MAG: fasciclin domain-containing protein [Aggregatilineales bacterium]